jgi:ubiquinone/menaquinone biosynthesis C-methylase UbiE
MKMPPEELTIQEIEELGYYDFMAYLKVPYFNVGGEPSLDLLAERCRINKDSHVLDVGCGTGGNSVHLAEKYGCRVTGIDISELMIERAQNRLEDSHLRDQLSFHVGDAYSLDFPDTTFDTVLTIFVSQFLDLDKSFPEFHRVLKHGGSLGINEMYRQEDIPPENREKADTAEQVFRELTDLPFSLRSPERWSRGFKDAGFTDVSVESFSQLISVERGLEMVNEMGGWWNFLKMLWKTLELGLRSPKIWKRYAGINKGKRVMFSDPDTNKYFGYVLGVGRKDRPKITSTTL